MCSTDQSTVALNGGPASDPDLQPTMHHEIIQHFAEVLKKNRTGCTRMRRVCWSMVYYQVHEGNELAIGLEHVCHSLRPCWPRGRVKITEESEALYLAPSPR